MPTFDLKGGISSPHQPTHLFECHGQAETFKVHGQYLQIRLDTLATQLGIVRHIQIRLHVLVQLVPILDADQAVHLHQDAGDAVGGIEAIKRGSSIMIHRRGLPEKFNLI